MPKTRMTALDVRACVNELKGIILGAKLANVYLVRVFRPAVDTTSQTRCIYSS